MNVAFAIVEYYGYVMLANNFSLDGWHIRI